MAKSKLDQLIIRPGKNGGHTVRHEFEPQARYSKGPLSGGLSMGAPPAEEHNFGPGDHQNLMKHIAGALALKMAQASGNGQPGGEAEPGEEE